MSSLNVSFTSFLTSKKTSLALSLLKGAAFSPTPMLPNLEAEAASLAHSYMCSTTVCTPDYSYLACLGCFNVEPEVMWLIDHGHLSLIVLQTERLKSRIWQILHQVRVLLLGSRWLSSHCTLEWWKKSKRASSLGCLLLGH